MEKTIRKFNKKSYDVLSIGSVILDIIIEVEDKLLKHLDLQKGAMTPIDSDRSHEILQIIDKYPALKIPGGSAANTLAGLSLLGSETLFLGTIGTDYNAEIYEKFLENSSVENILSHVDGVTGHAITFITEDKERTFATCHGVSEKIFRSDISIDIFKNIKILHVEGYMFANKKLSDTIEYFISEAVKFGVKISVDLSDKSIVKNHKKYLKYLLSKYADYIFMNEDELYKYTSTNNFEEAVKLLSCWHSFAIIKLGEKGSVAIRDSKNYTIEAEKVKVCNTNGAGDMYVAGFLYGLLNNFNYKVCGKIASYCASQVIKVSGARLDKKIDLHKAGLV